MKMEILLEPTSNKLMVEHAEFDESDTYVLERFYTLAGNPVKEILLKLNLLDHRSILTDSKEYLKMVMENYGSWEYFFEQLCESYDVDKYLRSDTTDTSLSSLAPLTPEELKVDKIVLSWILFTLSDSLRARLVVMRPKSAREAWGLISEIVKDNKRS
ncbi:hypothetical protein Tco_0360940 [Tanacetum coccineum]